MTMFVQYIYPHRRECNYSKLHGCLKLHSYVLTAHVHVLPLVCVANIMNEEGERATLENFVGSSS